MNLQEHYNHLYKTSIAKIACDNYEIDPMIGSDNDDRFGLSLVIRPPMAIKNKIQKFLDELKSVAPNQYYYPNTDIHITVISVISCYSGLDLSQINGAEYIELIKKCLKNTQSLTVSFKGVTASPSCIMLQGFINDNSLNTMREELRRGFKSSKLEQSMDERYLIQTAHATVFRFREKLEQKLRFLEIVDQYRNYDFGTFEAEKIELVFNDWYHQENFVKKLHEFPVRNSVANEILY